MKTTTTSSAKIFKGLTPELNINPNYPNFKPAPYITFINEGWLNGGHYVPYGTIMKLMGHDSMWKEGYGYQGFNQQNRMEHGFTALTNEDVIPKGISDIEQYIKIQGKWFRESTQEEIAKLESWIKNATK